MTAADTVHRTEKPDPLLKRLARSYGARARARRADLLKRYISLSPSDLVLDLGGGTGGHFHSIFPDHKNVVVADVGAEDLAVAASKYGYKTVQLSGDEARLPFKDNEFDLVFCSSVIEHCTGPKEEMRQMRNGRKFREMSDQHQKGLADEIRRIGKRFFVQTPYKYFLIESHSLLPGVVVLLPRRAFADLFWFCRGIGLNRIIPTPDFRLLTIAQMKSLFPGAVIEKEHALGLIKSVIAIKAA